MGQSNTGYIDEYYLEGFTRLIYARVELVSLALHL
jgi:hypothetical protein